MERETVSALNTTNDAAAAPSALALPVPANLVEFVAIYGWLVDTDSNLATPELFHHDCAGNRILEEG